MKGLKPGQTVTVVGRLEKIDSEIWLKPFSAAAGLHPVIVTTLNHVDLDQFLHANYPIGKTLGHALGMSSDVETDPSMVGTPGGTP